MKYLRKIGKRTIKYHIDVKILSYLSNKIEKNVSSTSKQNCHKLQVHPFSYLKRNFSISFLRNFSFHLIRV